MGKRHRTSCTSQRYRE